MMCLFWSLGISSVKTHCSECDAMLFLLIWSLLCASKTTLLPAETSSYTCCPSSWWSPAQSLRSEVCLFICICVKVYVLTRINKWPEHCSSSSQGETGGFWLRLFPPLMTLLIKIQWCVLWYWNSCSSTGECSASNSSQTYVTILNIYRDNIFVFSLFQLWWREALSSAASDRSWAKQHHWGDW